MSLKIYKKKRLSDFSNIYEKMDLYRQFEIILLRFSLSTEICPKSLEVDSRFGKGPV